MIVERHSLADWQDIICQFDECDPVLAEAVVGDPGGLPVNVLKGFIAPLVDSLQFGYEGGSCPGHPQGCFHTVCCCAICHVELHSAVGKHGNSGVVYVGVLDKVQIRQSIGIHVELSWQGQFIVCLLFVLVSLYMNEFWLGETLASGPGFH